MMNFNLYPMYRPAPSVVKNNLLRKAIFNNFGSKGLRLIDNNISFNNQTLFLLNRNFSSSPHLSADQDLEQGVDPYTTYGDSPIESDVEGSTEKLADKFIGNPSGLISEQTRKMESLSEKSKLFISELLQDRNLERTNLEPSDLEEFDRDTRELINDEGNLSKNELSRIASVRDDALDLIAGRSRNRDSDYESDYESDTSLNRIQGEYANLDSNTAELINNHTRFINNTLQNLSYNHPNPNLQAESDTSRGLGYTSGEANSSVEAGPSNFNPGISDTQRLADSNNKRKYYDTDEDSPDKKVKVDNSAMDTDSRADNLPNNYQSPLDYVLEKQQSDPYDIGDDLD